MSNRFFYNNIPILEKSFLDIISNKKNFHTMPSDWVVVVSDIENSTKAFEDGKYQAMNTISASTIALAINIANEHNTTIPFVYGGDGSTVVVPEEMLRDLLESLVTLKENTLRNFNLNLRVGYIRIEDLEKENKKILVSKFLITENYTQAIFLGEGLSFAEEKIKSDKRFQTRIEGEEKPLNLEGLQCRWDSIKTPKGKPEIVTLIIQSTDTNLTKTYLKILHDIEEIYGDFTQRHPITPKQTFRVLSIQTLIKASKIKYGGIRPLYILVSFLKALLHSITIAYDINITFFRHDDYTDELITATDTLKIDGTLKTIIAGSKRQRERLVEKLEQREDKGEIVFGYHISSSTTLTCYIHKKNKEYINLIDGEGGGYVQAAKMLKSKKINL